MTIYEEDGSRHSNNLILKSLLSNSFLVLLLPSVALATPSEDSFLLEDKDNSLGQVPSVQQLSDVRPTDWAYEASPVKVHEPKELILNNRDLSESTSNLLLIIFLN